MYLFGPFLLDPRLIKVNNFQTFSLVYHYIKEMEILNDRMYGFGIFQIYRKPIETLFWVNETFLNLPLWILITFKCLAEKFPACTISMVLDMKVEWRCFYYPSRSLHYSQRPVSEFSDWIVVSRFFFWNINDFILYRCEHGL